MYALVLLLTVASVNNLKHQLGMYNDLTETERALGVSDRVVGALALGNVRLEGELSRALLRVYVLEADIRDMSEVECAPMEMFMWDGPVLGRVYLDICMIVVDVRPQDVNPNLTPARLEFMKAEGVFDVR